MGSTGGGRATNSMPVAITDYCRKGVDDMPARIKGRIADAVVVVGVALLIAYGFSGRGDTVVQSEFAEQVDLTPLSAVAVQHNGRLKSFDSYARYMMKLVCGSRKINGQSAAFSYLDLMFRPEAYRDVDLIYVKHKDVRARIAQRIANDPAVPAERLVRFKESGLISPALVTRPDVRSLLDEMSQDLQRTSKAVAAIEDALAVSQPSILIGNLNIVPPAGMDDLQRWIPIQALWNDRDPHAGLQQAALPGLDGPLQDRLRDVWRQLAANWEALRVAEANRGLAELAGMLPQFNPGLYPAADKLELESWYLRYKALVWAWMIYLLAIVPLLMSVVYHWTWARRTGLVLFFLAFGVHTASIAIRWYLSGRIPNSNMFEAIMAATWFGGLAAFIIEFLVRKTAMRNLFALGAAVCAMVAMMCSHFMPVTLSSDIDHVMPVLNDLWLYIHTNVIIFSYCLIGMAAVTALLYLRYRLGGGDHDYARTGGAGQLMLGGVPGGSFLKTREASLGQVLDGATLVLMELSFVLLWAGIAMGAIWADHSWGRPWGWDPKEVFALNTFIIFLILVHVRLKVKDKGLWTAGLACVGCGVMLFNWIVVNFVITGLHSYA